MTNWLGSLASPADTAVLLLAAGLLLLTIECLRPGRIFPGAAGLLALLLALHRLAALPLRGTSVALAVLGTGCFALSLLPRLRWIATALAMPIFGRAVPLLVRHTAQAAAVNPVLGAVVGAALGLGGCLLLQLAVRARGNKRHRTPPREAVVEWQPTPAE